MLECSQLTEEARSDEANEWVARYGLNADEVKFEMWPFLLSPD